VSKPPFRTDTSETLRQELMRGKGIFPRGREADDIQGRPAPRPLTSPGRTVALNKTVYEDTIDAYAIDPLVNEWGIYIAPSPASIVFLAGGGIWSVIATVFVGHDSAQFVYYRSIFNEKYKPVPVVGIALAVHGQNIRVGLRRTDPLAFGEVKVSCAIVPRRPCASYLNEEAVTAEGAPAMVAIPAMSRHVKIFTSLSPGDELIFLGANGVTILGTYSVVDVDMLSPIPLPPDAAYVKYTTTAAIAKNLMMQFETYF